MALDVPVDRRIVGPRARLALVQAIHGAEPHEPETFWLEWKKEADLRSKSWRGELASHILGFANRDPRTAERSVEGFAYLVVGVSPGSLKGVVPADPAELEDWLSRYLGGADGPPWEPDYVTLEDKQVLVIGIESPRQGDPMWTLRKTFTDPSGSTHQEGRIFVRRNGQTSPQPSVAEIRMLEQRLTSEKKPLPLALEASVGDGLVPLDLGDSTRDAFLQRHRSSMMASLRSHEAPGMVPDFSFIGDGRTPAEYREEVDEYLSQVSAQLPDLALAAAMIASIGIVRLSVVNETDDNFSGVQVRLEIEGDVRVRFSADDPSIPMRVPDRPRAFGTRPYSAFILPLSVRDSPPLQSFHKRTIEELPKGGATVEFRTTHVRPGDRQQLEDLVVLPGASMAGEVSRSHGVRLATVLPGSRQDRSRFRCPTIW